MKSLANISVRWKIYLIAVVSIIGFGSYLLFNMYVSGNNAKLLQSLRANGMPALERSSELRVQLDRLNELLNTAVLTGEADYIESAKKASIKIAEGFDELQGLIPHKAKQLILLKVEFTAYSDLAQSVATGVTSGHADVDQIAKLGQKKEQLLKEVKDHFDLFIEQTRKDFGANIDAANHNAVTLLQSGAFIWVVNIIILIATVYGIARVILSNIGQVAHSLNEIASGTTDFSKSIRVTTNDEIGNLATSFNALMENLRIKTNDLVCMMESMHQGLFTICPDETIHHEYSAHIEMIFGTKDIAGRHYTQLLFDNCDLGSDVKDQTQAATSAMLGECSLMYDANEHLLVREYAIQCMENGVLVRKDLALEWDPIIDGDDVIKLMVTVRDVTEEKRMRAEMAEKQTELTIIGQILKATPQKFDAFLDNTTQLLSECKEKVLDTQQPQNERVAKLFEMLHTIKGNARTHGFTYLTNPVHDSETQFDELRKSTTAVWHTETLMEGVDKVCEALGLYRRVRVEN